MTPTLTELLRHTAALPLSLRPDNQTTVLRAVMRDLYETLTSQPADDEFLHAFSGKPKDKDGKRRSYVGWVMAAAHVLSHPQLAATNVDPTALRRLLLQELATLASIAMVNTLDQDEERREELIRRCLRATGQRLPNESERDAEDRLRQVDSIERHEVLAAAVERENRAREVREAMAKKAAEEAVPKVGREMSLPELSVAARALVTRMREHVDAPRWNRLVDDRLWPDDLERVDEFRSALATRRRARSSTSALPSALVEWIMQRRFSVPWFAGALRGIGDIEQNWARVPTMSRAELAHRPWDLVASDADLETMIIYRTSGTTGHIVQVPYDPLAAAKNVPLIETALAHYDLTPQFDASQVACFLVGAQQHTVTYPAALRAWGEAGFCKLNLRASEWPTPESVHRYFADHSPALLTGDPISFAEFLRLGIAHRPIAAMSTAVAMSNALSQRLATQLGCPVIDWYSLTETGPLAFQCKRGHFHQLPHDVYLEVLRSDGSIADAGERGEITVTGGRNPFVPLLRYRTGDFGYLDFKVCECGDPMPRLLELEGRPPVLFRAHNGEPVNPVDVSRILREYALVSHELFQRADGACELIVRPVHGAILDDDKLRGELTALFGALPLTITVDATLGDKQPGKIVPYRTELPLDE